MSAGGAAAEVVRDHWGFPVKQELQELYKRCAPMLEDEEAERSERWTQFFHELQDALPSVEDDESEVQLLRRALSHLAASVRAGEPPEQAAALLQRVSSLVQAGLPMSKRGAFWCLFLDIDSKRRPGEYQRLVAEVEADEAACLAAAAAAEAEARSPPNSTIAAVGGKGVPPAGVVSLVAHAAATKEVQYQLPYKQQRGRGHSHLSVDVFSIKALDCEEDAPCDTPTQVAAACGGGEPSSSSSSSSSPGSRSAGVLEAVAWQACASEPPPAGAPAPPMHSTQAFSDGGGSSDLAARQQDYLTQIDKDLHRTFPNHPVMDQGGRAALRRILSAYARRNAAVGYCQGLNFLGGTFLLLLPEEEAFWCLAAVVESLLGSAYFDEHMVAPQVDVLVFAHLLQGRFPSLWRHLAALEVDAASVTMHWFLLAFLNSLPLDSTLRVWDLLFFEGSPVVLFRVALALVEIYEQALMCTRESSDAYMLLQCCAQMTFDGSRLVDTAAIGYSHLRAAGLAALRQRHRPAVLDNLRSSFSSEDLFCHYVDSQHASPTPSPGEQDSESESAHPCFVHAFQRLAAAARNAEEASQRAAAAAAEAAGTPHGGKPPAGGRGGSRGGSARQRSPPASPLARVQQAVSKLAARLVLPALPPALPSGAVNAGGEEQQPLCTPMAATPGPSPWRAALPGPAAGGEAHTSAARHVRRVSTGVRGSPGASPTSALSSSAGSGASLGRCSRLGHLTPFTEVDSMLQREAASGSCTPSQPRPAAAGSGPGGPALALDAADPRFHFQSMPATPSELLASPPPPVALHRRALTAGDSGGRRTAAHRRRRRLTVDMLQLAELQPDLAQPGVAAALAIAANPSPRAAALPSIGAGRAASRLRSNSGVAGQQGAAGGGCGGGMDPDACAGSGRGCAALGSEGTELGLPVRALHFEEEPGTAIPRAATASPAALLAASVQPTGSDGCGGTPQRLAPLGSGASTSSSQPRGGSGPQQGPALLAVVAQLQEEVALAESRRHDAERAAATALQMATDLARQLGKVRGQVAAKQALVAELRGRLEASTEAEGALAAQQLAAEAEEVALERRRRRLAAADALIQRLVRAVSAASRMGRAGDGGSAASSGSGRATTEHSFQTATSSTPQSSCGSAAGPPHQ